MRNYFLLTVLGVLLISTTGCRKSATRVDPTEEARIAAAQAAVKPVPEYKLAITALFSRDFMAEIMCPTGKFVSDYDIKLKVKNFGTKTYTFKMIRAIFTNPTTKKSETTQILYLAGRAPADMSKMKTKDFEALSKYEIPPNTDGFSLTTIGADLTKIERRMARGKTLQMVVEFIGFDDKTLMRFRCTLPPYRGMPFSDDKEKAPIAVGLVQL